MRARYPISLHGVGLSLGSADRLREAHLEKLAALVERIEPELISEHLCWGALGDRHFNDLLPLPYTREALDLMVERVDVVQQRLRRSILIENVSSYLAYRDAEMSEFEFIAELSARSGCGILLDINNLFVNAANHGFDAGKALAVVPKRAVREIHLAGHSQGDNCLIDDHGSKVAPEVWALYRLGCEHLGAVPTLIEWDTNIPALDVLLHEAATADSIMQQQTMEQEVERARA